MTSREFCYWLQGFIEIGEPVSMNKAELDMVKAHLNMVFVHEIDPSYPKDQQQALNEAHGKPKPGQPVMRC